MSVYSIFPKALDGYAQLPLFVDNITPVNAEGLNRIRSAIVNIEAALGVLPQGNFENVSIRFDSIDTNITAIESAITIIEESIFNLPNSLFFNEAQKPTPQANKGAIFVSDGSDGLVQNNLYYFNESGVAKDLLASSLQESYDGGNVIITSGGTDIEFDISATGGGLLVDGDGPVSFGSTNEVSFFKAYSEGLLELQSRDNSLIWMQANDAVDKVLTVKGTNSGAGAGSVKVEADDEIQLYAQKVNLDNAVQSADLLVGTGDPNGVVTAVSGSLFLDTTTPGLYQGSGGTTWTAVGGSGWPTTVGTDYAGRDYEQALVAAANGNLIISPNGTGAIVAQVPDGTAAGGNSRGSYSVDLQRDRTASAQVASGNYSVIGGGRANTVSNIYSTVSGGRANTASGTTSTVSGGRGNTASGLYSTLGGGGFNTASSTYSTVGGGYLNTASGNASTVGGGRTNTASGNASTVGGGRTNTASGYYSTVSGGLDNLAPTIYSTVSGGRQNTASSYYATVGGGRSNQATGLYATVGGGYGNQASGFYSATVSGGYGNQATDSYSTVSGGYGNQATNSVSTVGGGRQSTASGVFSTISGGFGNQATNTYSTVGGGQSNTASGIYSAAGGAQGLADHLSEFAHASGRFATNGDAQYSRMVLRRQTTDATPLELSADGAAPTGTDRLSLVDDTGYQFHIQVIARDTSGTDSAWWDIKGCIVRSAGAATTTLIGTNVVSSSSTAGAAAWTLTATADTVNGALKVEATGAALTTIRWVATVHSTKVAY